MIRSFLCRFPFIINRFPIRIGGGWVFGEVNRKEEEEGVGKRYSGKNKNKRSHRYRINNRMGDVVVEQHN